MKFSMNNGETSGKITELKKKKEESPFLCIPATNVWQDIPGYQDIRNALNT